MREKGIVLFSGGIDSTTALYWAKQKFSRIMAITFDYNQIHRREVDMARIIAGKLNVTHLVMQIPLKGIVHSALIDDAGAIPVSLKESKNEHAVPPTYVPFRNGIFLSIAAAVAETHKIYHIVTGFNNIDSPDYPDTTSIFTRKMAAAINQGTSAVMTGHRFTIHTPLINKTKKEIIEMGGSFKVDYSYSISCYRGNEIPCLGCPACEIRAKAFADLGMEDPLIIRLQREGRL